MGIIQPAGLTPTRVRNLAPIRNKGTRRQFTQGFAAVTGPRTSHETVALPCEFEWVRFWYANDDASAITLTKATYAPSAVAGSIPKDAAGASLTPQPVLFNAGGADSIPGSTSGSTATITIPAGTAANPALVCSDWMQVSSLPRTDVVGALPLIMHRGQYAAGYRALVSGVNIDINAFDAQSQGLTWTVVDGGGDQATSLTPTFGTTPRGLLYGVDFMTARGIITVLAGGDSLTRAQGSTSGYASSMHYACAALSTSARPVVHINAGISGQTTLQYFDRLRAEIARYKPSVFKVSPWSPNDTFTSEAAVRLGYGRAVALAAMVRDFGGIPIFSTPMPTDRITTTAAEDLRVWVANRVRDLATASGFPIADYDKVLSDGAYPARIKVGLGLDGTHLPDAGYVAISAEDNRALRAAIG